MNAPKGPAAPPSGTIATPGDIPDFAILAADPEIAPLLEFEPVKRQIKRPNGWTAELQREFIARLAWCGSPRLAAESIGKNVSGIATIYKQKGADSFRAAWDAARPLGVARRMPGPGPAFLGHAPGMNPRRPENRLGSGPTFGLLPGQVLNEFGEPEDEASFQRRAEDAKDSIATKLLRCRRAYLAEICGSPGKRAAFEILSELPIDWDKAARLEAQADEPYNIANARQADMVLTAESGWSFGEIGYGPDRKREMREALNAHRIEKGQEPIDWSAEDHTQPSP